MLQTFPKLSYNFRLRQNCRCLVRPSVMYDWWGKVQVCILFWPRRNQCVCVFMVLSLWSSPWQITLVELWMCSDKHGLGCIRTSLKYPWYTKENDKIKLAGVFSVATYWYLALYSIKGTFFICWWFLCFESHNVHDTETQTFSVLQNVDI